MNPRSASKPTQTHLPLYLANDTLAHGRYSADWSDSRHHYRRFVSEFIGTFGFVFSLSAGAACFSAYGRPHLSGAITVALLTMVAAMWLVIAIYALGDLSAHFNPAMTFAFALRGDMSWRRAGLYWLVQCAGAIAASLLAKAFFGVESGLASVHTPSGQTWQSVAFEALLTACFVLLILAMTRGPKLNGPFTPLAVAGYVLSFGTFGGLYEGAAFNPARALGPDVATGNYAHLWVYFLGDASGVVLAVLVDRYLRGAANVDEAAAAEASST